MSQPNTSEMRGPYTRGPGKRSLFRSCAAGIIDLSKLSNGQFAKGIGLLACCFLCSCSAQPESNSQASSMEHQADYVVAANYPIAYFSQRIAGELVEIRAPMLEQKDPANWNPTDEQIVELQQARLILFNGAGYEKWRKQISLPLSSQVDTLAKDDASWLTLESSVIHRHGPDGESATSELAPGTWLDPKLAISQATSIHKALAVAFPEFESKFSANFAKLLADLQAWDSKLAILKQQVGNEHWLCARPVYQYLARYLNCSTTSFTFEAATGLSPEQWDQIETALASRSATKMLWPAVPIPETKARLEKLGVAVIVIEVAEIQPENLDFLEAMELNRSALNQSAAATAAFDAAGN